MDAIAALVPAEVLAAHAFVLTVTTETTQVGGEPVTTITDAETLRWFFFALVVVSILLYVAGRWKNWERLDVLRVIIPPIAFTTWTMLQRATAFDAVAPQLPDSTRTAVAVIIALLLGVLAAKLGYKADQKNPSTARGKARGAAQPGLSSRRS